MVELSDDDIQRLLETGGEIEQTKNVQLYQSVFNRLTEQPKLKIDNLASAVVKIIIFRNEWKSFYKSIVISFVVIMAGSLTLILAINKVNHELTKKILIYLETYKWIILFIILLVVLIEAIDKKFLINRHKQNKKI